MRDSFHDLETRSPAPIKNGTHAYAEKSQVLLWSYALEDDQVKVWDVYHQWVWWQDDLSGVWQHAPTKGMPVDLERMAREELVWFHNGGMFDFVVLKHAMPQALGLISEERRRDTMVQAFAHSLPGALDKLGEVLQIDDDKRKITEGKKLMRFFCVPDADGNFGDPDEHPEKWLGFVQYAGGDIVTMREVHRKIPMWNYKGKQVDLWHADMRINNRGFAIDRGLAEGAVRMAERVQARLAKQAQVASDDAVMSATQRDVLKDYLESLGVDLPDLRADTLERRMDDPDLPAAAKELIGIRLAASMNSVAKYKTMLKGMSSDSRMRGTQQFRGAGRTGRWAHRLVQPGNLPRPQFGHELIEYGIGCIKADDLEGLDLVFPSPMTLMSSAIRGAIVAMSGKKLCVADLSNIEGRTAAWLAGEEWKLQAFRDFDEGTGHDLYILAYAKSFNVAPDDVPKKGPERQIGKVEELMFQYGGGVGAWITGAATYGIDLDQMTEQVWDSLPKWAKDEAEQFMWWLYEKADEQYAKTREKLIAKHEGLGHEALNIELDEAVIKRDAAKLKARHGLPERTFIACDAIKRLWRRAHPEISSYWKELEDTVRTAIASPGVTFPCRKVKIRRDGAWLRIGLPSGRALCYPNPKADDGGVTYTGFNQYTRQWGRVGTYGGKLFENITQAVACDQFAECLPMIEAAGYMPVLGVHDEWLTETPDTDEYSADELARLMCSDLQWNSGLPLAAAGFETYRYRKE